MKRLSLIIFLAAIFPGAATAQPEFINGYIIRNDGTYTYGQVEYLAKGYTTDECIFRWFDISTIYSFQPEDIAAFGFIHGMKFRSVSIVGRRFFMACLAEGELDLLFDGRKMYLDGMGLTMVPLDNRPGNITLYGEIVTYNDNRDLLGKLPASGNGYAFPEDLPLNPEAMTEVVAGYNRSRGAEVQLFAMKNPEGVYEEMQNLGQFITNYGLLAGMNASKYDTGKTIRTSSVFVPDMNFFEVTPVAGIFYNRPLSRKNNLFSLNIELQAFRTNVYMYDESRDYTGITRSDINISFTGIKLPVSLRISFLNGSYKPYISAGVFTMTNIGGKFSREGEVENSMHVVRPFTDNSISLQKNINGLLGGIGLKKEFNPKQCATLELRAEYGTGIYDREGIKQKTLIFNIIAGIDFL